MESLSISYMKKIKKCLNCDSYTLSDVCDECGGETVVPDPPKFSPEDKYGEYRRRQKELDKGVEDG